MDNSLKKKLKFYSAFAAVIFVSKESESQIVYADIIPDISHSCCEPFYYNLDLNGDGHVDFRFRHYYLQGSSSNSGGKWGHHSKIHYLSIDKYENNSVVASNNMKYPSPLNINDIVGKISFWKPEGTLINFSEYYWHNPKQGQGGGSSSKGLWKANQIDKYLGLKINIDGKVYYGWARLDVYGNEFKLKDYAYNIQPDQPILAGQKSLCLPPVPTVTGTDSTANQIKLTACPATGYTYQWKLNGNKISGATHSEYIAHETGNFTVEITDNGGCSNNSDVFSFVSGVNDISVKGNSFQSFLSNHILFIQGIPKKFFSGELNVFDVTGRKSAKQRITGASEQINLSHLPDGLYILELSKNELSERRKFILH